MTSEKENKYKIAKTITAIINLIPIFIGIEYLVSPFGYSLLLDLPKTTLYHSLLIGLSVIVISLMLFVPIFSNTKRTEIKNDDKIQIRSTGAFLSFSLFVFSAGVYILIGGKIPGVVGSAGSFHSLQGYDLMLSLIPITIGIIITSVSIELFSDEIKKAIHLWKSKK